MTRLGYMLSALVLASGCHLMTVGENFRAHALERAAFDMECPKEKLQLTGLNRKLDEVGRWEGAQVGVTGCDKRAVYVNVQNNWLLNSGSNSGSSGDEK